MSWTIKMTAFSGKGTSGRNALDSLEFIVSSNNVIADSARSEVALIAFLSTQVNLGQWLIYNGGVYFGYTTDAGKLVYTIPGASLTGLGNVLDHIDRELIDPTHGTWRINCVYRDPNLSRQSGDASFSFSTTGGSQHITSSVNGSSDVFPAAGVSAPANATLIGAGTNGQPPTGIDIEVPAFKFKTEYFISTAVAQQILNAAMGLKGPVNSNAVTLNIRGIILQCPPHTLKLDGLEGQERAGQQDWALTHHWSYSANKTGLTVGGISVASKPGWFYLEAVSFPYADTSANMTASKTAYVVVHQVYDEDDLSQVIPNQALGTWAQTGPPTSGGSIGF